MLEHLLGGRPERRIHLQHILQQVNERLVLDGGELPPDLALISFFIVSRRCFDLQLKVFQGSLAAHERHVVIIWRRKLLEDECELIGVGLRAVFFGGPRRERVAGAAGEEVPALGLSTAIVVDQSDREHLGKYAADAPDVNGLAVVLLEQDELRGSVPPGGDVRALEPLGLGLFEPIRLL